MCVCFIIKCLKESHSGCCVGHILEGRKGGSWEINEGPIATHLAVGVEPWTRTVAGAEGKHSKLMSGSKFVGKDI